MYNHKTILILVISLFYLSYTLTDINPQSGENLNYLTQRIGTAIDQLDLEVAKDFNGTFTCLGVIKKI